MKKSNKTYVYNPEQAKFYIANGATVLDTGIHYKTHKVFWVFDFNATTPIFHKWCLQMKHWYDIIKICKNREYIGTIYEIDLSLLFTYRMKGK